MVQSKERRIPAVRGGNGLGSVGKGGFNGFSKGCSFGKESGDGRGEGTACAMGGDAGGAGVREAGHRTIRENE